MKLRRHDEIELAGVYARNPLTDKLTPYLQQFACTQDIEGETIPRLSIWPFVTPILEPIRMSDVVSVNHMPIEKWLAATEGR